MLKKEDKTHTIKNVQVQLWKLNFFNYDIEKKLKEFQCSFDTLAREMH